MASLGLSRRAPGEHRDETRELQDVAVHPLYIREIGMLLACDGEQLRVEIDRDHAFRPGCNEPRHEPRAGADLQHDVAAFDFHRPDDLLYRRHGRQEMLAQPLVGDDAVLLEN